VRGIFRVLHEMGHKKSPRLPRGSQRLDCINLFVSSCVSMRYFNVCSHPLYQPIQGSMSLKLYRTDKWLHFKS